MMDVLDTLGLLAASALFGAMLFFSGVIAPFVFTNLESEAAGRFIRRHFPIYYLVIAGCSLIAAISLGFGRTVDAIFMGLILISAIFARQLLMPKINHFRDLMSDDNPKAGKSFERLHRLSVWINAVQLIGTFAVLIRFSTT